jgi:5-oxoprolinase (ATP-hydrolysing) subunit C
MISVLKPALQTTVQDLGRRGYRHLGIGLSGAMDSLSLTIGNYLVGNAAEAAGIEFCVPPARLRFDAGCAIALTGADCSARLDGAPIVLGRRVPVEAGQMLDLEAPHSGFRAYLCIAGGIDVPLVLGSRSTDLQAALGGLDGRLIRRGDRLKIIAANVPPVSDTSVLLPPLGDVYRVMPGPEFDGFDAESRELFFSAVWKVTNQSNRMGYRLEGPTLVRRDAGELKSHAVFPGFIQVPAGGAPIVLMADAQATGGYPRFATVIAADQWRLAQIAPGASIRFAQLGRAEAQLALQRQRRYLQRIHRSLYAN